MASLPATATLYTFLRCPYAIRARLALAVAGIAYERVEVSLRDKPQALLTLSPKATVPVLHLPSGEVLEQSLDIMRWALAQHDPEGWLLADDAAEMERWIQRCDQVFKPLLDRYKYADRFPELTRDEHLARAMEAFILPFELALQARAQLQQRNEPETSDAPKTPTAPHAIDALVAADAPDMLYAASFSDAAIFPFVRQFAFVDKMAFAEQPVPAVHRWLATWLNSARFQSVMHKREPAKTLI